MARKRSTLKVERLYVDINEQYFFTPDGEGVIWFDDKEDAMEQTGNGFGKYIIRLNDELADF